MSSPSRTPPPATSNEQNNTQPEPIIHSFIGAGHRENDPGPNGLRTPRNPRGDVPNDPGAQLTLPAGTVINGTRLTQAQTINESAINVEMRDLVAGQLPQILTARGINPNAISIERDVNQSSDNLHLLNAIRMARNSDTVPVEIHQEMPAGPAGGRHLGVFSLIRSRDSNNAQSQTSYDMAQNMNRRLAEVGPEFGIRPNTNDKTNGSNGVFTPGDIGRGNLAFLGNNKAIILEFNALRSAETYAHYDKNKGQIAEAIGATMADNIERELAQRVAANPALAERAYLDNHPSRQQTPTEPEQRQEQRDESPSPM